MSLIKKYQKQGTIQLPDDYIQFENYSKTAPENRRPHAEWKYGDPKEYDHYGMWDALGKPKDFETALKQNPDWKPNLLDNLYHGFSTNPNTGVWLKPHIPNEKNPGSTSWMENRDFQLSTDKKWNPNRLSLVFDPELQRMRYIEKKEKGGLIRYQQKGLKTNYTPAPEQTTPQEYTQNFLNLISSPTQVSYQDAPTYMDPETKKKLELEQQNRNKDYNNNPLNKERLQKNVGGLGKMASAYTYPQLAATAVLTGGAPLQQSTLEAAPLTNFTANALQGMVAGMSVDDLYQRMGGKNLGDALDIKSPQGRFIANFVSPGAIVGPVTTASNSGAISKGIKTTVKQGKNFAANMADIAEHTDIAYKIKDIPRSFTEIKELNKIKARINNTSMLDVMDFKKSRMLSRKVPDYDPTYNSFHKAISKKSFDVASSGRVPFWRLDDQNIAGHEEFALHYPTNNRYRNTIKYPRVKIGDVLSESSSSMPDGITIGLDEKGKQILPFDVGSTFNHELDHQISYPTIEDAKAFKTFLDFRKSSPYYTGRLAPEQKTELGKLEKFVYTNRQGTEVKARLGQMKDLLGLQNQDVVSKPQLRAALKVMNNQEKYGLNNNMEDWHPVLRDIKIPFFRRVKDKNKMLQYMNDVNTNPFFTAHKKGGLITYKIKTKSDENIHN